MNIKLTDWWYQERLKEDRGQDYTTGRIAEQPVDKGNCNGVAAGVTEEEFSDLHAFGALVQMLRRDRRLGVQELAAQAAIDAAEIVCIEKDPAFVPKPRTVTKIAEYFKLPVRSVVKIANVTTAHGEREKVAAVRFAANAANMMELTAEEKKALQEFVDFLCSQK
jgi:DNA-binding XRE family transcriptional regulator